nr:hypothetical protein [Haladaptatus sp. R4]
MLRRFHEEIETETLAGRIVAVPVATRSRSTGCRTPRPSSWTVSTRT